MESYLVPLGAWAMVTQGTVLVICALALRRGIVGEVIAPLNRRHGGRGIAVLQSGRRSAEPTLFATGVITGRQSCGHG